MFLKLRRKLMYWLGLKLGQVLNPYQVVRDNLLEEPDLFDAFAAFDNGKLTVAFEMFRDAAMRGNVTAQYNLGICYETKSGVPRDDQAAEEWYRKAAEQGLGQAQYDLSAILAADIMAYQDNRPSEDQEKRLVEAYMWLVLANAQGHSQAAHAIPRVEAHMTPDQIAKAQRLANDRLGAPD